LQGIIVTGGEAPDKGRIQLELEQSDYIIAADSGFDTCLLYGCTPDLIVGDMDSVKNKKKLDDFPPECVKIFQKDKDETDTEIAFRMMLKHNIDQISIIGGGGGRIDHFMGILSLFDRKYYPKKWYTLHDKIVCIDGTEDFYNMKGMELSFFPAGLEECTMKSTGLKWNLNKLRWSKGEAGLSNVVIDDPFSVKMESGKLLMVSCYRGDEGE